MNIIINKGHRLKYSVKTIQGLLLKYFIFFFFLVIKIK